MTELTAFDWFLQIMGTLGSVSGIELNRRKKKICWWIWNGANVFWIWLYVRTKLWFAVATMTIYGVYNFIGWLTWRADEKENKK